MTRWRQKFDSSRMHQTENTMSYETLNKLLENEPAADRTMFGKLTAYVLTTRLSLKDARGLEYKVGKNGVFIRTRDDSDLYGVQGSIGLQDAQRLGFTSIEDVTALLDRVGVRKMGRQKRRPRDFSLYD